MLGLNCASVKLVVTRPKTPVTVTMVPTSITFRLGVTMVVMPAPTLRLLPFRTPRLRKPKLVVAGLHGLPVLVS
jgi:hypothetical protein